MKIEVIGKRVNPLLKRREIMFKVDHEGATPSREEVKNKLAAMLNAKKELVVIERMRSEYGKRETRGYAKIYKSERGLREIERAHIIQRNALKTEIEEKTEKVETKKEVKQKPKEKTSKEEVKVETKKEVKQKPKEKTSKEEVRAKTETKSKGE